MNLSRETYYNDNFYYYWNNVQRTSLRSISKSSWGKGSLVSFIFHSPNRTRIPDEAVLILMRKRVSEFRSNILRIRLLMIPVHAMCGCHHPSIVDESATAWNPPRKITRLDDWRLWITILNNRETCNYTIGFNLPTELFQCRDHRRFDSCECRSSRIL